MGRPCARLQIHMSIDLMQAVIHDDIQALAMQVALRIRDLAAQAITDRGVFHLALAGGQTPRECYEKLRSLSVDWARVQIYFGDERCVARDDARRNDSMVREALLNHISIPQDNIHSIAAELGARQAAALYCAKLPVRIDLVLLGMGEDGHTASLFPDNPANVCKEAAVPVFNAPKPPSERVSLGLTTLNAARVKLFLVAGESKRAAIEQILHGARLPASLISHAEWHLDRAALPIENQGGRECKSE